MPPMSLSPVICKRYAVSKVNIILKTTAPPIPQNITFFLCSTGNFEAIYQGIPAYFLDSRDKFFYIELKCFISPKQVFLWSDTWMSSSHKNTCQMVMLNHPHLNLTI